MTALQGSLWDHTGHPLQTEPLDGDLRVDLVVIGGGYTGLSAALHAARAGASVCVIEAGEIGHGGSGRNVGLVNAGLWLPPGEVAKRMGDEAAERLNTALSGGPSAVFDLIEAHQIQCEALRNGTLHCAHSPAGQRDLQARHDQLRAFGAPVALLDAAEARARVGSDAVHGALFDPRAGTVQPKAYAQGLAQAAIAAGARIIQHTRAEGLHHDGQGWVLRAGGHEIRAEAAIEAVNAYGDRTDRFAPMHFFQMATEPLPENLRDSVLPGGEGGWDTAMVMSSFRRDQAGRVLIGAIGRLDHGASGLHRDWARRKLTALFPQLRDVPLAYAWQGKIASTSDHIPKILRLGPNGLSAFGYSGRGIGTGTLFGKAMAEALLTGREDGLPMAPVDRYSERFTGAKGLYYETGAALTHMVRDR